MKRYGLRGDKRRQAVSSLRAYEYQLWRTLHAWLELSEGELIFVEGVEDYDRQSGRRAELVQIKDKQASGRVTLKSEDAINAINNFWNSKIDNRDFVVFLYFITTAEPGIEAGSPFGIAGLDFWNDCRDTLDPQKGDILADQIRGFLLSLPKVSESLRGFLETAPSCQVREELIARVLWVTNQPRLEPVKEAVRRKLVLECDRKAINSRDVDRVMDRLHREVWNTATRADSRILDRRRFVELFDEATSITLRRDEAGALLLAQEAGQRQNVAALTEALGLPATLAGVSVRALAAGEPPPLPDQLLERPEAAGNVSKLLDEQGLLVVTGSTGMGKTTLVAMVASAQPDVRWLWLNCRGRKAEEINVLLWNVSREIDDYHGRAIVVIDDVDPQGDLRMLESTLLALSFTVRARAGRVVFITSADLPQRLRLALNLGQSQIYNTPPFTESEIKDLLIQYNCPRNLMQSWAKIVSVTTSGHPQLVNARVRALSDAGFPSPTATDLLETPRDLREAGAEARKLMASYLENSQRELLYRLSLCIGDFPRELALSIAKLPDPIAFPGDAFDGLVGPWIEVTAPGRFSVSPLVKGSGSEVHDREWVKQTRSGIARSILERDTLSPIEVSEVLMHGLVGEDGGVLAQMIVGLMRSGIKEWPALARFLSWVPYVGMRGADAKIPGDAATRLLFRMFQYRLAAYIDSDLARELNSLIEREIYDAPESIGRHAFELIWCSEVLFRQDVQYPADLVITYVLRWLHLIDELREEIDLYNTPAPTPALAGPSFPTDPASALPLFFVHRLDSPRYLEELIGVLEATEPTLRERMLRWPAKDQTIADHLVNQVWLAEYERDSPNWHGLVTTLERLYERACAWHAPALARAAASVASRTYDQNMGEPDHAEQVLQRAEEELGASLTLQHALATLRYNDGAYEAALSIWEAILPEWENVSEPRTLGIVFAHARAARAAAHLSKWGRACDLFVSAYRLSLQFDQPSLTIASLADAAFAAWKAGMASRAVSLFRDALKILENIPNDPGRAGDFTLHKRVGHVLLWVERHDENHVSEAYAEPPPGCCSNLDSPSGITELNPTPVEMSWVFLAGIEHKYTNASSVYNELLSTPSIWEFPAASFKMRKFDLEIKYGEMNLAEMPYSVMRVMSSIQDMKQHEESGLNVWNRRRNIERLVCHDTEAVRFYIYMIISFLFGVVARRAGNLSHSIEEITASAKKCGFPQEVLESMSDVSSIVTMDSSRLFHNVLRQDKVIHEKLVASLAIAESKTAKPEELLYANAIMFQARQAGIYLTNLDGDASSIVCQGWRSMTDRRFLLRSPNITVSQILKACERRGSGWGKAANVILAAIPATRLRFPEEMMHQLRVAAADNDGDVTPAS
jgi:tetratricopeptide (TPR) repeat protein